MYNVDCRINGFIVLLASPIAFTSSPKQSTSIFLYADNSESDLGAHEIALKGRTEDQRRLSVQHGQLGLYAPVFSLRTSLITIACRELVLRYVLCDLRWRLHTSKPQVICPGVDLPFATRANDVA